LTVQFGRAPFKNRQKAEKGTHRWTDRNRRFAGVASAPNTLDLPNMLLPDHLWRETFFEKKKVKAMEGTILESSKFRHNYVTIGQRSDEKLGEITYY